MPKRENYKRRARIKGSLSKFDRSFHEEAFFTQDWLSIKVLYPWLKGVCRCTTPPLYV